MFTIKIYPPDLTIPVESVLPIATKADLLEAADIWGYTLPKSWRKDRIVQFMTHSLNHDPQYI